MIERSKKRRNKITKQKGETDDNKMVLMLAELETNWFMFASLVVSSNSIYCHVPIYIVHKPRILIHKFINIQKASNIQKIHKTSNGLWLLGIPLNIEKETWKILLLLKRLEEIFCEQLSFQEPRIFQLVSYSLKILIKISNKLKVQRFKLETEEKNGKNCFAPWC